MRGYCIALDGTMLPDLVVKEIVLGDDFAAAYYTVCKYITKRTLKPMHKKIIKHKSEQRYTLDLAPRGFGKSTVGDVDYCITRILRDPNIRGMIGSKTQAQAQSFLKEVRAHFESNTDLIRVFGDLKGNPWNDNEFTVSNRTLIRKEATLTALGASGAVVSKHFDFIIGDDMVGFENARTETQRRKLKEWFYSALLPTLEPDGDFHILGTRYHPSDLYQDFIESGNYSVQVQMAINKKGDKEVSLWEEKFSLETLKKIRAESGSIIFGMQYQNDVELAKGDIFKADYFRYYDRYEITDNTVNVFVRNEESGEVVKKKVRVFFGIDLAITQSSSSDFFVVFIVGVDDEHNVYALDYFRGRLTFDQQFNKIVELARKFPMVERIGIETVAYQLSMAQELRRSTHLPIINLHTSKDKVTRAMRRSALFENGKVFLRENMSDFEEELLLMSKDGDQEHDDLFDGFDFAVTVQEQNQVNILDRSLFRI